MTDWPIVGLTGALVLITGYYAWQNKRMADQNTRMVQELQKQREAMAHQLREMRIQTQLGLYRPRLAVMRGVRKALSYVARDAKVSGEVIAELIRALGEKSFYSAPSSAATSTRSISDASRPLRCAISSRRAWPTNREERL